MRIAGALTLLLLLAGSAAAEMPRTFGTSALTSHTIQAMAFVPLSFGSAQNLSFTLARGRACTPSGCTVIAPLLLPEGAVVSGIELDACDTNSDGQVRAVLFRLPATESQTLPPVAVVATGHNEVPGCRRFAAAVAPPLTIDNFNNAYAVEVSLFPGGETRLNAVRVFYRLQVSPAPATATFADVPTDHPFFPFIEALVRAGITAGCDESPPMFCPDAHVTREQMAAFLARALGLHWPRSTTTGIGGGD